MTSTVSTPTSTKLNPLAVAGLIVSIVGLALFFTRWLGGLIALVGTVLSIVGRTQIVSRGERGKGSRPRGSSSGSWASSSPWS